MSSERRGIDDEGWVEQDDFAFCVKADNRAVLRCNVCGLEWDMTGGATMTTSESVDVSMRNHRRNEHQADDPRVPLRGL